jgi:hypothetical protein
MGKAPKIQVPEENVKTKMHLGTFSAPPPLCLVGLRPAGAACLRRAGWRLPSVRAARPAAVRPSAAPGRARAGGPVKGWVVDEAARVALRNRCRATRTG